MDDPAKTLWCGNLSNEVSEEILYDLFLQAGPLEKVVIPRERDGRRRGYSFITFKHDCSVPYAMEIMRGTTLFGRPLNLQNRSGGRSDEQNSRHAHHQRSASLQEPIGIGPPTYNAPSNDPSQNYNPLSGMAGLYSGNPYLQGLTPGNPMVSNALGGNPLAAGLLALQGLLSANPYGQGMIPQSNKYHQRSRSHHTSDDRYHERNDRDWSNRDRNDRNRDDRDRNEEDKYERDRFDRNRSSRDDGRDYRGHGGSQDRHRSRDGDNNRRPSNRQGHQRSGGGYRR